MAKKAKPKTKPKAKTPRQKSLFKGNYIREIDTAAGYHESCKAEFASAAQAKHDAENALTEAMHKHKLTSYETADGVIVTVNERSKCTTKKKKKEAHESE